RLRLQTQDLATVVRDVLDSYAPGIDGIEVLLRPATVELDPLRMEQVVRNLIDNARKYGAPPVSVGVYADSFGACLSVRDHGPGVAAEQRAHLFDRFYQADHPM